MAIVGNPPPRFNGAECFGDVGSFRWSPLVGGPKGIDLFLGDDPGTTIYGNQRAFGLSGLWTGPTQADVRSRIDTLASYAGISASLGVPTGERSVGTNFIFMPWYCYFVPSEFRPGSIQPYAGNQFSTTFRVVFRSTN